MKLYGYRSFDTMAKMRLNPVLDEIPVHDDLMGVLWKQLENNRRKLFFIVFINQDC